MVIGGCILKIKNLPRRLRDSEARVAQPYRQAVAPRCCRRVASVRVRGEEELDYGNLRGRRRGRAKNEDGNLLNFSYFLPSSGESGRGGGKRRGRAGGRKGHRGRKGLLVALDHRAPSLSEAGIAIGEENVRNPTRSLTLYQTFVSPSLSKYRPRRRSPSTICRCKSAPGSEEALWLR